MPRRRAPTRSRNYSNLVGAAGAAGAAAALAGAFQGPENVDPAVFRLMMAQMGVLDKHAHAPIPSSALMSAPKAEAPDQPDAAEEEEFEEHVDQASFTDYTPVKVKIGKPHPDPLVESSSLAAVVPPDAYYQLQLPHSVIEKGKLSSAQLETIVYACQSHEIIMPSKERRGFFLGDGAGVGKGRQLAGIIWENFLAGRTKSAWMSVSSDLRYDARRDLDDIGASSIQDFALNRMSYDKRWDMKSGVMFCTYSSLISSSRKGKGTSRLDQLVKWLGGEDFDGCIMFDECHRAKNLIPTGSQKATKMGIAVDELQRRLPNARVVYCSATGATEPRNMAYMSRLAIWGEGTPFPNGFSEFLTALEKRGSVGAMELVAMHLKRTGVFICRTLSYTGCTFEIVQDAVPDNLVRIYDGAAHLWQLLAHELDAGIKSGFLIFARRKDNKEDQELDLSSDDEVLKIPATGKNHGIVWRYFWGSHQRFFRSLCVALKVPSAVKLAERALEEGKCVVIGLQSTGEAAVERAMRNGELTELDDFISSPMVLLSTIIKKIFPLPSKAAEERRLKGNSKKRKSTWRLEDEVDSDDDEEDYGEADDLDGFVVYSSEEGDEDQIDYYDDTEEDFEYEDETDECSLATKPNKNAKRSEKANKPLQNHKRTISTPESTNRPGVTSGKAKLNVISNRTRSKVNSTQSRPSVHPPRPVKSNLTKTNGRLKKRCKHDRYGAERNGDSDLEWDHSHESDMGEDVGGRARKSKHVSDSDEADPDGARSRKHRRILDSDEDPDDRVARHGITDSLSEQPAEGFKPKKEMHSQNTGFRDDEDSDIMIIDLTSHHHPISSSSLQTDRKFSNQPSEPLDPDKQHKKAVLQLRKRFESAAGELNLPGNPLDTLIDRLGGVEKVAEMTGRKSRLVRSKNGKFVYQQRNCNGLPMDMQNMEERDQFMSGRKLVAIISEAASAGVSLQADRRKRNQRKRVHITLELPWSADKAVQQLGRTHRANQATCPEYKLLMSPIGGEKRFAASVARRLEMLGALTQGDRRATVGARSLDLGSMNLDNKYGREAVRKLYMWMKGEPATLTHPNISDEDKRQAQEILARCNSEVDAGLPMYKPRPVPVPVNRQLSLDLTTKQEPPVDTKHQPSVDTKPELSIDRKPSSAEPVPDLPAHDVLRAWSMMLMVDLDKGDKAVMSFFNKLLGLEVYRQDIMFGLFVELLENIVGEAKKQGKYDLGIKLLQGKNVKLERAPNVVYRDPNTGGETLHFSFQLDRGVNFDEAMGVYEEEKRSDQSSSKNEERTGREPVTGFWLCRRPMLGKRDMYHVLMAFEKQSLIDDSTLSYRQHMGSSVVIIRPCTGRADMIRGFLLDKYRRVSEEEARRHWDRGYNDKTNMWRIRKHEVLAGSILPVWTLIDNALSDLDVVRMRCARVVLPSQAGSSEDGQQVIGLLIDTRYIRTVLSVLSLQGEKNEQAISGAALAALGPLVDASVPVAGSVTMPKIIHTDMGAVKAKGVGVGRGLVKREGSARTTTNCLEIETDAI